MVSLINLTRVIEGFDSNSLSTDTCHIFHLSDPLFADYDPRGALMKIDGVEYKFKRGVSNTMNKRKLRLKGSFGLVSWDTTTHPPCNHITIGTPCAPCGAVVSYSQ